MGVGVDLLQASVAERHGYFLGESDEENARTFLAIEQELGSPWRIFYDDPVGFVEIALGESVWGSIEPEVGQRAVLAAVAEHDRVAVPSAYLTGKSHSAARIVAWFLCTRPVGATRALTTAHRWRQVKFVLWPYLNRLHERHHLPGQMLTTEWKMDGAVAAFGFTASD